jgi:N-acetylglucosamine malate deacetylase 1
MNETQGQAEESHSNADEIAQLRYGQRGVVDVVIFGAHPDDAELLCGGSIIKMAQAGKKVAIVDCTDAELSTNGNVALRKTETAKASELLGIQQRLNLGFADGALGRSNELTKTLVLLLRKLQPSLMIGPPSLCRHPDHQALYHALKDAHFFCGLKKYEPQAPYIPRPKFIQVVEVHQQRPSFLVDITQQWSLRTQVIRAYASQFESKQGEKTFINSGFLERLERRYRSYGEDLGVEYAEPFICDFLPKLNLPSDLA